MMSLDHLHVVHVLCPPTKFAGFCYFAMEYLPGGDLARAILERQIRKEAGLQLILQICNAVSYAHSYNMIHRDIKPHNILLDGNGHAKLTDFDLVWAPDSTGGTQTGGYLGTFLYAAPEAMTDASRADKRSDIYSLGMTTMFILFGNNLPLEALINREEFIDNLECANKLKQTLKEATTPKVDDRLSSLDAFCDGLCHELSSLTSRDQCIPLSTHSIGFREGRDNISVLFPRRSALPARTELVFQTSADYMTTMNMDVCQGEDSLFSNNKFLTQIQFVDMPPWPMGLVVVKTRFTLDVNNLLSVEVMGIHADSGVNSSIHYGGITLIRWGELIGMMPAIPEDMEDTWNRVLSLVSKARYADQRNSLVAAMKEYLNSLEARDKNTIIRHEKIIKNELLKAQLQSKI